MEVRRPFWLSPEAGPRIVYDGQSLNLTPFDTNSYPAKLQATRSEPWWNESYGGKSWTVLLNGDSQVGSVAVRYAKHKAAGQPVLAVLNGGQYDLLQTQENQTGAQAYADLLTYCAAIRAQGVDRIIVHTMSPIAAAFNGGQDPTARITAYNDLVKAGNAAYDAVADVAGIAALSDPSNLTYYADGGHWTSAGTTIVADFVRPIVSAQAALLAA